MLNNSPECSIIHRDAQQFTGMLNKPLEGVVVLRGTALRAEIPPKKEFGLGNRSPTVAEQYYNTRP